MRISGNLTGRFVVAILPTAVFFGIVSAIFAKDKLQAFLVLGAASLIVILIIDRIFISEHLGRKINTLRLPDQIFFNEKVIVENEIIKITKADIYPRTLVKRWSINTICFVLNDQTEFRILDKPTSFLSFFIYLCKILFSYNSDKRKSKAAGERYHKPLSAYFIVESSKTLNLLFAKYPGLQAVQK